MKVIEWFILILMRSLLALLAVMPLTISHSVITLLLHAFVFFRPRYLSIARKNLKQAFPDETEGWREEILRKSFWSLSRLIVDSARLPSLDDRWVREHVEFPNREVFEELRERTQDKGMLIATGHLGSFELLAHSSAVFGFPLAYVVRNFKMKTIDDWWKSVREQRGNKVIDRKGAYKQIAKQLADKRMVGILFDQNVTRNLAIFVDFFGRKTATTKAFALAALRSEVPIVVACVGYLGDEKYVIDWKECKCDDVYENEKLSHDEKLLLVTQRASDIFASFVKKYPEAWFWMHRRWKTTPDESVAEDFYKADPKDGEGNSDFGEKSERETRDGSNL